ncbi:hypothetical protein CQW23_08437 [Capsicum baccatum]|uniref:histone acetyltransferase n=1 Tax=Capsicum baccatum TaxID=33114 RepID=A0A2G2X903_CAPBA|nr:hypothetical protein CQW23_08437 [Capsicum baccatum]
MLDLLLLNSQWHFPHCPYPNCGKVKGLLRHGIQCKIRLSRSCVLCKKMWYLLQLHARAYKDSSDCHVPRCRDLKQHLRRLQQQSDSQRRAAVLERMRQQAEEITYQDKATQTEIIEEDTLEKILNTLTTPSLKVDSMGTEIEKLKTNEDKLKSIAINQLTQQCAELCRSEDNKIPELEGDVGTLHKTHNIYQSTSAGAGSLPSMWSHSSFPTKETCATGDWFRMGSFSSRRFELLNRMSLLPHEEILLNESMLPCTSVELEDPDYSSADLVTHHIIKVSFLNLMRFQNRAARW